MVIDKNHSFLHRRITMLAIYHPNRLAEFSKNYLAEFMEAEAVRLRKQRSSFHTARHILVCISYFGDWLKKHKIPLDNVNESVGTRFLSQFRPPTKRKDNSTSSYKFRLIGVAVRSVVRHAKELYPEKIPKISRQREIIDYYDYISNTCNISKNTCVRYRGFLETFLESFFPGNKISLYKMTPRMIRDYINQVPSTLDERKRKDTCSALRHYLHFSRIRGRKLVQLEIGLPTFQSKHQADADIDTTAPTYTVGLGPVAKKVRCRNVLRIDLVG